MQNDVTLKAFPRNYQEALTMLYLESRDLSAFTPEQLVDAYNDTYQKINAYIKKCNEENMFKS